jgi:NADP-dependent 3-hydroxy acid dehydrogenase YdfG
MNDKKLAVVTGASSGIGAATAVALAENGFDVVLGARRLDRIQAVAEPIGARYQQLDVTDPASIQAFVKPIDRLDLLVNNAGGALGVDRIDAASDDRWRTMWEVNFLGLARMTRELLPALLASGQGHIVNIGSIAGFETYPGGAGYTGAKHAVRALTKTLRVELVGRPIRVTEICPGLVETEFSMVRFDQDAEKAAAVYKGMTPLVSEDVADCIAWAATRPPHVNIDEIVVRPRDQATATVVHREG